MALFGGGGHSRLRCMGNGISVVSVVNLRCHFIISVGRVISESLACARFVMTLVSALFQLRLRWSGVFLATFEISCVEENAHNKRAVEKTFH